MDGVEGRLGRESLPYALTWIDGRVGRDVDRERPSRATAQLCGFMPLKR